MSLSLLNECQGVVNSWIPRLSRRRTIGLNLPFVKHLEARLSIGVLVKSANVAHQRTHPVVVNFMWRAIIA